MSWIWHAKNKRETATPVEDSSMDEALAALARAKESLRSAQEMQGKIDSTGKEVRAVAAAHRELLERNHFGEAIRDSFGLRKA